MSENGNKAQPHLVYRATTHFALWREHDGEACYMVGKVQRDPADSPAPGFMPMYDVQFDDGVILPCFPDELFFP